MGFAHALEVLHALAQVAHASGDAQTQLSKETLAALPFPHLQQRLQQTLRGVVLVAVGSVVLPLAALCFVPMLGSSYAFPGVVAFTFLSLVLVSASLAQLLVRYVMLPAPRPFLPDRASIYGAVQTLCCVVFDACARVYQEPQLVVLLTLCVFHSWLWKTCLYAITTGASVADPVAAHFGAFAVASGVVSFVSLLAFEASVGDDPFVLDPRAALATSLQRDAVRAVRRGVVAWSVTHALLVLTQADESVFALGVARAFFHVSSGVSEHFVWLTTASMFRTLLFRATYGAVAAPAADGALVDALARPRRKVQTDNFAVDDLFASALRVDAQSPTPLNEQFVAALRARMASARKQLTARASSPSSAALAHVEALDALFELTNVQLATKFDAAARHVVFASEPRWRALLQRTTAVIDSFTLSLELLNAVPARKTEGDAKFAATLDQSIVATLRFVLARASTHALLLLNAFPHLANVRIARAGIKSPVRYFVEAHAQFALRRFVIDDARRRVFERTRVVFAAQELLCSFVSASRTEDKQGMVQVRPLTVPRRVYESMAD